MAEEIQHRTNRVEEQCDKAIGLFVDKPRFRALLASWLTEGQEIEDAFWQLLLRRIDNPDTRGITLDFIGKIVGQERGFLLDDEYKIFLTARIKANRSSGKLPQLIDILALLVTGEITAYTWTKDLLFVIREQLVIDPDVLAHRFMDVAKAPGDHLTVMYTVVPYANTIILDDEQNPFVTGAQSPGDENTVNYGGGILGAEVVAE